MHKKVIIFIFLLTPYLVLADTYLPGVKTSITRVDSYIMGGWSYSFLLSKPVAGR